MVCISAERRIFYSEEIQTILFCQGLKVYKIFFLSAYLASAVRIILLENVSRRILKMALNKVELCGVNTSRLPLLKEEEKEALFVRIKEGDEQAREEYILSLIHI